MLSSTLLGLFPFVSLGIAGYVVQDDYSPENFFDKFGFFTNDDPTNGRFASWLLYFNMF